MSASRTTRLILASSSPYRRALLERLGVHFDCVAPAIDESRQDGESPRALCERLARTKARAVTERFPEALVIGSDQLAVRGHEILGKPGTEPCCVQQLLDSSGRRLQFLTAVHVARGRSGQSETHVDETFVVFRTLARADITRYVAREQPLDRAGGFKAESLGIALFDRIESNDPTALTGLPLLWLCGALRRAGLEVP